LDEKFSTLRNSATWMSNQQIERDSGKKTGNLGNEKFNKPSENSVEILISRLDFAEERISGIKDKAEELVPSDNNK
jgi:hypothetical protein